MASARFGVAALKPLVVAIEKNDAQIEIVLFRQSVERFDQRRDREIAGAYVDANGQRQMRRRRHDQVRQQRERKIVDRLVAHILESLERGRAPGSRHAGDDENALGRSLPPCGHDAASSATALKARRSFASTDASNGARAIKGTSRPSNWQARGSGRRSISAGATRSTTSRSGATATEGARKMPIPRTSIWPAITAGAVIWISSPSR